MPEPLFDCYLNMINAEVAAEVADAVVGAITVEGAAPGLFGASPKPWWTPYSLVLCCAV